MLIADQAGGKSNQLRSIFEEFELHHHHRGYPTTNMIAYKYYVHPDMDLYVRLSSWHEKGRSYNELKRNIANGHLNPRHRYKVLVPSQVTPTSKLGSGEDVFMQLHSDFNIRRSFAVWLNPDRSRRVPFSLSPKFARFMSSRRHISALAIDGLALHPSAAPTTNSINSRLLCDLLFRV